MHPSACSLFFINTMQIMAASVGSAKTPWSASIPADSEFVNVQSVHWWGTMMTSTNLVDTYLSTGACVSYWTEKFWVLVGICPKWRTVVSHWLRVLFQSWASWERHLYLEESRSLLPITKLEQLLSITGNLDGQWWYAPIFHTCCGPLPLPKVYGPLQWLGCVCWVFLVVSCRLLWAKHESVKVLRREHFYTARLIHVCLCSSRSMSCIGKARDDGVICLLSTPWGRMIAKMVSSPVVGCPAMTVAKTDALSAVIKGP